MTRSTTKEEKKPKTKGRATKTKTRKVSKSIAKSEIKSRRTSKALNTKVRKSTKPSKAKASKAKKSPKPSKVQAKNVKSKLSKSKKNVIVKKTKATAANESMAEPSLNNEAHSSPDREEVIEREIQPAEEHQENNTQQQREVVNEDDNHNHFLFNDPRSLNDIFNLLHVVQQAPSSNDMSVENMNTSAEDSIASMDCSVATTDVRNDFQSNSGMLDPVNSYLDAEATTNNINDAVADDQSGVLKSEDEHFMDSSVNWTPNSDILASNSEILDAVDECLEVDDHNPESENTKPDDISETNISDLHEDVAHPNPDNHREDSVTDNEFVFGQPFNLNTEAINLVNEISSIENIEDNMNRLESEDTRIVVDVNDTNTTEPQTSVEAAPNSTMDTDQ